MRESREQDGCCGAAPRTPLIFGVESGTDARLVDGLASRFDLTVIARAVAGGCAISQKTSNQVRIIEGPSGRLQFAVFAGRTIRRLQTPQTHLVLQNEGVLTLIAHLLKIPRPTRAPVVLVCSAADDYYACRKLSHDPLKPYRRAEHALVQGLAKLSASRARHYVVLSKYLSDLVRSRTSSARIDIIPVYGVDTAVFAPPSRLRTDIRQALGLPVRGSILFYSSRIAPEKDPATLLQAFKRLLAFRPDAWLLHLSGGHERFAGFAQAAGLAHRVISRPAVHPVTTLPAYYHASDLCVQTSHAEGLGFSVLEALSCQTPVVATATGGLAETIQDGLTGWTCPPRDPIRLVNAIEVALSDSREESIRMARAGRRMVESRFESNRVFNDLFQALQSS